MFDGLMMTIQQTKLVLQQGQDCSFHPYSSRYQEMDYLPNYCLGIVELDGDICVVIDFSEFLGIDSDFTDEEKCIYKVSGETGKFALIIPNPKLVILENNELSDAGETKEMNVIDYSFINYFKILGDIHLLIYHDDLMEYLSNDITLGITNQWNGTQIKLDQNITNDGSTDGIQTNRPNIDIGKSTSKNRSMKCQIDNFNFTISEEYITQIITKEIIKITSIPSSPPWVTGVIKNEEKTIPFINLNLWLDIPYSAERKQIVVICDFNGKIFAFPVNNLRIISNEMYKDLLHEVPTEINGLPFTNIIHNHSVTIFHLNLMNLAKSVSDENISSEWESWKNFFTIKNIQFTKPEKDDSASSDLSRFKNLRIRHPKLNLVLSLTQKIQFFEDRLIEDNHKYLPTICDGLINIENEEYILINLLDLLGLDIDEKQEYSIIKIRTQNARIALSLPIPELLDFNLDSSLIIKGETNLENELDLPISGYIFSPSEIFIHLKEKDLIQYVNKNVTSYLKDKYSHAYKYGIFNTVSREDAVNLQTIKRRDAIKKTSSFQENIVIMKIENTRFSIPEELVIDINNRKYEISELPDSPEWVRGIIDHNYETIPIIDLATYFDIREGDFGQEMKIIVNVNDEKLCITCQDTEIQSLEQFNVFHENSYENTNFPFTNILISDNLEAIYNLNISCFTDFKHSMDMVLSKNWQNFLSSSCSIEGLYSESEESEIFEENNWIVFTKDDDQYITNSSNVNEILNTSELVIEQQNGYLFSYYDKNWINHLGATENISDYTIVFNDEDITFEMEVEDLSFVKIFENSIGKDILSHLSQKSGVINSVFKTEKGYAFEFSAKNHYSSNISESTDEVIVMLERDERIIEIESAISISEEDKNGGSVLFNTWDKELEVFLIITNPSDGLKYAIPTDKIQQFSSQIDDNFEIEETEWGHNIGSHIFMITEIEGEKKVYRVPTNSYLFSISKNQILDDENGNYIEFSEEAPIQIKQLTNGG